MKRFAKLYPETGFSNKTGLSQWKGKQIIPLDRWIEIKNTSYGLDYFPDDFDQDLTHIEGEWNKKQKQVEVKKWGSDYQELMEYTKNLNYGRFKCFRCLLSPDGDDPIFIGINRLVAKGLNKDKQENNPIEYPCQVVNRFQCPYEKSNIKEENEEWSTKSNINIDDLFRLQRMAFFVEIALAGGRKEDSKTQIRNKQDLFHALTDRDSFAKVLQQASGSFNSTEYLDITVGHDEKDIVDYFMRFKNCLDLDELRFY